MTGLPGARPAASFVGPAAYVMLLVLGGVEGMVGSFQYSRLAPVGAILFCVGIFVTCLAGGWGMQSIAGAFMPAIGWVIASFVFAQPMSNGSVIITNTSAGKWYLYGGTLSATAAAVIAFGLWVRTAKRSLPAERLLSAERPVTR